MKHRETLIALLSSAVALPLGANAAADRSSGTLTVNTTLSSAYRIRSRATARRAHPSTTVECVRFSGARGIPGLGRATVTYVKSFDQTICPDQVTQQKTTLIDVAGKGQIKVAMDYPVCVD